MQPIDRTEHAQAQAPETLAPVTAPTDEDRLAAAACYLSAFVGWWVFGPLAVYFWKGKSSRFVAFHSIQATILTGWLVCVAMVASGFFLFGMFALARMGIDWYLPTFGVVGALGGVPVLLLVVAAWKAFVGKEWAIPLIGRAARSFIAAPPGGAAR